MKRKAKTFVMPETFVGWLNVYVDKSYGFDSKEPQKWGGRNSYRARIIREKDYQRLLKLAKQATKSRGR